MNYDAQYIKMRGFTAIMTPHFIKQMVDRKGLLPKHPISRGMVDKIWCKAEPDQTVGFLFGRGYVYCLSKYNRRRKRWELEFITFTPNRHFHTSSRQFAVEIKI